MILMLDINKVVLPVIEFPLMESTILKSFRLVHYTTQHVLCEDSLQRNGPHPSGLFLLLLFSRDSAPHGGGCTGIG